MLPTLIINDVPIQCINRAAVEYRVPAILIISVLKTENGHVGVASKNNNGTYDLGPMQINTSWLPKIAPYGFTWNDLEFNACKNVEVGAWILGMSIASGHDLSQGVGNYHSHTPYYNMHYSQKVLDKYRYYISVLRGQR
ncbi:MAG: lytic transglycosylase domain-containing protein [Legionellales bacterium]|nr:lytic transglycosylase domain-containing protein [Legionellales bacterium]